MTRCLRLSTNRTISVCIMAVVRLAFAVKISAYRWQPHDRVSNTVRIVRNAPTEVDDHH